MANGSSGYDRRRAYVRNVSSWIFYRNDLAYHISIRSYKAIFYIIINQSVVSSYTLSSVRYATTITITITSIFVFWTRVFVGRL